MSGVEHYSEVPNVLFIWYVRSIGGTGSAYSMEVVCFSDSPLLKVSLYIVISVHSSYSTQGSHGMQDSHGTQDSHIVPTSLHTIHEFCSPEEWTCDIIGIC